MSLTESFENKFPSLLMRRYETVPSEDVLSAEYARLTNLAVTLQCDAKIIPVGNGFDLKFRNISDNTKFNRAAFNPKNMPMGYSHVEAFEGYGARYVTIWADIVRHTAERNKVSCHVEVRGNKVVVLLDSIEDVRDFTLTKDRGAFNAAANLKFRELYGADPSAEI